MKMLAPHMPRRKLAFDLVFVTISLPLVITVILVLVILVRLTSHGPAIYYQTRLGRDRRPFTVIKLRSLRYDPGAAFVRCRSLDDPRITRFGRHLRRTHLDELPQFFNVLRLQMSLVGPRPHNTEVALELSGLPGYDARFDLRPGLTSLGSICGAGDDELEQRYNQGYFARPYTVRRDLRIIIATAIPPLRRYWRPQLLSLGGFDALDQLAVPHLFTGTPSQA